MKIKTTKPHLSDKERAILEFLTEHLIRKGYSPTQQEIGDKVGLKRGLVQYYLVQLENKKYVYKKPKKRRNLNVLTA